MEIYGVNGQQASIMKARAEFIQKYCERKGWKKNELSLEQVLEIRQQRGWQAAGQKHGSLKDVFKRFLAWFQRKFWRLSKTRYSRTMRLFKAGKVIFKMPDGDEEEMIRQFREFGRRGVQHSDDAADALAYIFAAEQSVAKDAGPPPAVE